MSNARTIVAIVPQIGCNDKELLTIKDVVENANLRFVVASFTEGKCIGKYDSTINATVAIANLKTADYEGVVFVGGYHISALAQYAQVKRFVKSMDKEGKVIGAHCVAPAVILAPLGLLKGKKATVFATKDGWSVQELERKGAMYVDAPVVIEKNIVTGRNEEDAQVFAKALVKVIKSN